MKLNKIAFGLAFGFVSIMISIFFHFLIWMITRQGFIQFSGEMSFKGFMMFGYSSGCPLLGCVIPFLHLLLGLFIVFAIFFSFGWVFAWFYNKFSEV